MQELKLNTAGRETVIRIGMSLCAELSDLPGEPLLLVDENVYRLHTHLFEDYRHIIIPQGERNKTLKTVEDIYRLLIDMEVDRSTMIVGVGGGLATDVAGYVASTFLRGLSFGFISTTLLGQVDASIGGKNGVNLDGYKNMIGNIRQPDFVWCDLSLLTSLSQREYVSGIAEVIKYGAIKDPGFFAYLESHMSALLQKDPGVLEYVVGRSVTIKAEIVEKDEQESNLRRILNFGHTIGHAIERNSGMLHGEAVGQGMILAAELSQRAGYLDAADAVRLGKLVESAGLPLQIVCDPGQIFDNMRKDKKREGEFVNFVLLDELGSTRIEALDYTEMEKIIHDLC